MLEHQEQFLEVTTNSTKCFPHRQSWRNGHSIYLFHVPIHIIYGYARQNTAQDCFDTSLLFVWRQNAKILTRKEVTTKKQCNVWLILLFLPAPLDRKYAWSTTAAP